MSGWSAITSGSVYLRKSRFEFICHPAVPICASGAAVYLGMCSFCTNGGQAEVIFLMSPCILNMSFELTIRLFSNKADMSLSILDMSSGSQLECFQTTSNWINAIRQVRNGNLSKQLVGLCGSADKALHV